METELCKRFVADLTSVVQHSLATTHSRLSSPANVATDPDFGDLDALDMAKIQAMPVQKEEEQVEKQ
jgi:hypothetical protein